jgi:thiol-disulfide isomerase/thioredoxin
MRTLLAIVLLAPLAAQTVREDDTPLRERCDPAAPEMLRLAKGTPVKLRVALAAPATECAAVTVEIEGQQWKGYLDKPALEGLETLEEQRRQAAATEVRTGVRAVTARPWRGSRPVFTKAPPKPAALPRVTGPAPEFSVVSLEDPAATFTKQSLLGKTYIVQFWAPWCRPCVAQTAEFRRLYDTRKGSDFEILTLALDGTPEPAPWPRARIEGGFGGEIARRFAVERLPATFLVDRQGRIVGRELEGAELERALAARP